jgi:iron complex transport system substrate-binding protein
MSFFASVQVQISRIIAKSIFIFGIFLYSCSIKSEKQAGRDIIDTSHIVAKAEKFSIEKMDGYTLLTIINPWQGAIGIKHVYYLLKRGAELPSGLDTLKIIRVPVKKIICMSTTQTAMISSLGEENTICGMSGTGLLFDGKLQERAEKGLIEEVGYEASLNKELILKISPDLIMMYGVGNEAAGYVAKLKELGIKIIFNADYLETDPLSKTEWIKLFGSLYCKESLADSIYNSEVEAYNNLKSYINSKIVRRPKVLLGLPFKDTWYISPGNSFISKLIADAGGIYLWQNTESSFSMPYGIENVYLEALTADFWLNIGTVKSSEEISLIDQRLKDLPCYKSGNLFNNNKRTTPTGGNDYWERGAVFPHLLLKDLAIILHPDLFSKEELFLYQKIY